VLAQTEVDQWDLVSAKIFESVIAVEECDTTVSLPTLHKAFPPSPILVVVKLPTRFAGNLGYPDMETVVVPLEEK
jgi:hypothetical protein